MKTYVEMTGRQPRPFPKLMQSTRSDIVILATSMIDNKLSGTILRAEEVHELGERSSGWRAESFIDFEGKLTLEND